MWGINKLFLFIVKFLLKILEFVVIVHRDHLLGTDNPDAGGGNFPMFPGGGKRFFGMSACPGRRERFLPVRYFDISPGGSAAFGLVSRTTVIISPTNSFICIAWALSSSEAEADSSALAAFC